jgi:hypothetical protein
MVLGAGGRISQSIIRDPYPASKWNHAATVVFNVQLLNAACFQAVTGCPPPPTPVSAEEYARQGLPFFEIYNEPASDIVGGFDAVKSVATIDGREEQHYTYPIKSIYNPNDNNTITTTSASSNNGAPTPTTSTSNGSEYSINTPTAATPASTASTTTTTAASTTSTLINPQGPLCAFRHVSEIEADLARLTVEDESNPDPIRSDMI